MLQVGDGDAGGGEVRSSRNHVPEGRTQVPAHRLLRVGLRVGAGGQVEEAGGVDGVVGWW